MPSYIMSTPEHKTNPYAEPQEVEQCPGCDGGIMKQERENPWKGFYLYGRPTTWPGQIPPTYECSIGCTSCARLEKYLTGLRN